MKNSGAFLVGTLLILNDPRQEGENHGSVREQISGSRYGW